MKTIPLSQGKFALVDDEDFALASQYKWHAYKAPRTFYALSQKWVAAERRCVGIRLHRLIMNPGPGEEIDHWDHDGLNCQKSNLRICKTHRENEFNQQKKKSNSSGYIGVCWSRRDNKWQANIRINGRKRFLGYFSNIIDAAKKYDQVCRATRGATARTNF